MSNKFKIGDKVRVLPYDQIKGKNEWPSFVEEMKKYCGKEFAILGVVRDICYTIGDDLYGYWNWREDWLEPAEPEFELGEELFLV